MRSVVGTAHARSGSRRRTPLSLYLVGLLILFLVIAVASALVVRAEAERAAEERARADTQFAAELAASEVSAALAQVDSTVSRTAANPGIVGVFTPGAPCNVSFGAVGIFQRTRLDFVMTDGTPTCSSALPVPAGLTYAGTTWLGDALRAPSFAAPVVDPRTGRASAVSTAPVPGRGVLVIFVDLTELGATLATRYAGPRELEFLVTTPDVSTALASSFEAERWTGGNIAETAFARAEGSSRPDLAGVPRVYGEATTSPRGWKVFSGAERAAVLSSAESLFQREVAVTGIGLLVLLVGTLFIYRRSVGPIDALSRAVRATTDPATAQPVAVGGPAEIAALGESFNQLIATVKTHLADRRHAEAGARAMLDASLDAVVGMDENGNVIEWSPRAVATFGWQRAEAIGKPLVSLIVPERYKARHIAGLQEYRRSGVGPVLGRRIELEACTRDGREIPVELSITPAESPTGHVFTAFIRDISAQRASVQERLMLEERLRQSERLEGIGRLAGGIAHDFNNILAVVMNYSQFVEDTLPADSEVRDDVVQIRLAAERGATFTRQLLTFARRGAVNPQDVQLNTVIGELRTMLRRTIPQSVKIDLRLAPDLWTVCIDVGQLEQLLLNLIVNAADAMPDGGTVVVETANVESNGLGPAEPNVTAGRHVRLEVIDTGLGMPKDVVARAFEPFFTTKARGKGTGLGLATAYGIVQQAQGAISIQSVVGQGTTIRVHLPAEVGVAAEPARIRVSSVPAAAESEAVVFVVEDETAVRKAVMRILSDSGYNLLQAAGPTSALDLARMWSGPIDLLLTDIVMPDLSGDELARELRKARPNLRVVYMTGYSGEIDSVALRVDGPLVRKPFTREALLAAIEGVLAATP
jgi:PAS domain S-box-containing protein